MRSYIIMLIVFFNDYLDKKRVTERIRRAIPITVTKILFHMNTILIHFGTAPVPGQIKTS